MNFEIRHRISDLEEEVYEFNVGSSYIRYVGFMKSKRKSVDEPFGYDWHKVYSAQGQKEIEEIEKEFEDSCCGYNFEKEEKINEVHNKYNPVMHGLLSGTYSFSVYKDHPLKISKEEILEKAIEHIKTLKIC